ncbi:MAG: TVP38/TMEM64 family protein [Syntrophaceae bacterium]|nr:TVP38/TMEM64 family protein [Syntrophaceae bacterium]
MANYKFTWKSALGYAVLILGLCLLLYYYRETYHAVRAAIRFFSHKEKVLAFVASYGAYSPLVFIGVQFLQVLVAPIPGELTGFVGGYLFGVGEGFLYSTIGLTAGSWVAFLISRRFGLPFVRRFVGQEIMDKFDYLMEHKGAFFSFIFFLIPGMPKDYFCYLLGLSPMHIMTFLVISTVGRIPGTLLLSLQGQAVRSEEYRFFFVVLGLGLVALVLTLIYRDQLEKWLHRKHPPKKKPPKRTYGNP